MGQPSLDPILFDYGILTEASDIRAHVSVVNRAIYVFRTAHAVSAIREDTPLRFASQPGVVGPTASGWLVSVEQIPDLRRLRCSLWPHWARFGETDRDLSTSAKGALAVECVRYAMKAGRFPFWIDADEDDRQYVQISGVDILVFCKKRIQVKCDWRCGDKPLGTGNVFLQKAERNPRRLM